MEKERRKTLFPVEEISKSGKTLLIIFDSFSVLHPFALDNRGLRSAGLSCEEFLGLQHERFAAPGQLAERHFVPWKLRGFQ